MATVMKRTAAKAPHGKAEQPQAAAAPAAAPPAPERHDRGEDKRWRPHEWDDLVIAAASAMANDPTLTPLAAIRGAIPALPEARRKDPKTLYPSSSPNMRKAMDRLPAKAQEIRETMQLRAQQEGQEWEQLQQMNESLKQQRDEACRQRDEALSLAQLAENKALDALAARHPAPQGVYSPPPIPTPYPSPSDSPMALIGQAFNLVLAQAIAAAISSPQVTQAIQRAFSPGERRALTISAAPAEPEKHEAPPPAVLAVNKDAFDHFDDEPIPKHISHESQLTHAGVEKRKRVLVVGLLGSQEETIKRTFGAQLDLRFVKDEPTNQLLQQAKGADKVFGVVSFMSKPQKDAMKKARANFTPINGTTTELSNAMRGYLHDLGVMSKASFAMAH